MRSFLLCIVTLAVLPFAALAQDHDGPPFVDTELPEQEKPELETKAIVTKPVDEKTANAAAKPAKTDEKSISPASHDEASDVIYNIAILQGLNKVTGHVSRLEGPVGKAMHFGSLEIIVQRCWKSSPEERPENAGLLDISEAQTGEEPKRIFLGWMFSSSPGLSGLEHPVYDVNVLSCEYKAPEKSTADKKDTPAPKAREASKKTAKAKKTTKP